MEFINQWFWLFLLLPVAAVSGWIVGRRGGEQHSDTQVSKLSTTYFRGLNYLLNEQPDKAIELFLHIAELDKDTFETQVAIGHLFRRRGEVDRAIRLHQADDVFEQHAFPLAAAADDSRQLTCGDLQIHPPQHRLAAQRLFHSHQLNHDTTSRKPALRVYSNTEVRK